MDCAPEIVALESKLVSWQSGSYSLTPRCRVLLEKLTGLQIVKKFPALHGTRRFITALTSVRHLSLSWGSPIQSIYPHPTSWRSILILANHLRLGLPNGLLPSGFHTKIQYILLSSIRITEGKIRGVGNMQKYHPTELKYNSLKPKCYAKRYQ